MQVAAGVAAGLTASLPLVHKNDAEPKVGARRSVAIAVVPFAAAMVALHVLSATAQVTVEDAQSPGADGIATTGGGVWIAGRLEAAGGPGAAGTLGAAIASGAVDAFWPAAALGWAVAGGSAPSPQAASRDNASTIDSTIDSTSAEAR